MPRTTYKVKWEREPCPECQPGPHSIFALRKLATPKEPTND